MPLDPESADFTFVDARGYAQEIFELLFTNWGLRVVDADPTVAFQNLQYPACGQPGIPDSIAGIAIGPRSTVDRVWTSFFRQKPFPTTGITVARGLTRRISLGSPLIWPQAANAATIGVTNSPTQACRAGAFYVFPKAKNAGPTDDPTAAMFDPNLTTMLPTQYVSGVDGTTLLPFDNSVANHELPYLHLYLYLKPVRQLPGPRFVMQRNATVAIGGTRTVLGQYPISGRKRLRLVYTAAASGTVQIGLLRGINEVAANNLEVIAATSAAGTHGAITIDDPCADYAILYGTLDAPGNLSYTFTATDDPSFT